MMRGSMPPTSWVLLRAGHSDPALTHRAISCRPMGFSFIVEDLNGAFNKQFKAVIRDWRKGLMFGPEL